MVAQRVHPQAHLALQVGGLAAQRRQRILRLCGHRPGLRQGVPPAARRSGPWRRRLDRLHERLAHALQLALQRIRYRPAHAWRGPLRRQRLDGPVCRVQRYRVAHRQPLAQPFGQILAHRLVGHGVPAAQQAGQA